jgi:hypothetical protein
LGLVLAFSLSLTVDVSERSLQYSAELAVANLEEIHWNSSAFDSLVLSVDKKEIVQSLVERHATDSNRRFFDDIIRGKGQSLVILLQYDSGINPAFSYSQLTFFLVVLPELERL